MRQLFPPPFDLGADADADRGDADPRPAQTGPVDPVDLDAAYWVPDPGTQFVSAVMISSADGAAVLDGRSGGLGNAADKELFALLRAQADVVLVGAGTARIEGYGGDRPSPAMRQVRERRGLSSAPRIAVVTASADLDPSGPLFTDTEVRPIVITCRQAPHEKVEQLAVGADVVIAGEAKVDLADALDQLAARGLVRVTCEGGPTLLAQLLAAGRLDELALTLAPQVVAGDAARITAGPGLAAAVPLELVHVLEAESYLFLRYRAAPRPPTDSASTDSATADSATAGSGTADSATAGSGTADSATSDSGTTE